MGGPKSFYGTIMTVVLDISETMQCTRSVNIIIDS